VDDWSKCAGKLLTGLNLIIFRDKFTMTLGGGALALACLLSSAGAVAQPTVVALGAYPEGLLWHGGRMLFTEMGADRVSIIDGPMHNPRKREFWHDAGCGPTSIAPFGPSGFLVNCHLGQHVVEVSAAGVTGRRFRLAPGGKRIQDPNASVTDGQGGVFFPTPEPSAPAHRRRDASTICQPRVR
jgi:sugar lactone lactonase YvrE